MSEVAEYACREGEVDDEEIVRALSNVATNVLSGLGQSKVVEDAFQRARDREEKGVKNRHYELTRQWADVRDMAS